VLSSLILLCVLQCLTTTALAGMIGFPAARQQPLHLRFELAGDSFKEALAGAGNPEANSGRALVSVALGLTEWSEVYARFGLAEFNVDEALFGGDFGVAFGGGARLRLFKLPWGNVGLTGQYLQFTSDDDDSAGVSVEGKWREVDVALGIGSRRFGAFQFYGGAAYHYSEMTLQVVGSGARTSLKTDLPVRFFVGTHIYPLADFPGGQFLINLEFRIVGEIPQFTFGFQYVF
jgi:hypothetical protein